MDADARATAGVGDGLLRLAIGCEAVQDLVADLESGLSAVQTGRLQKDRFSATG